MSIFFLDKLDSKQQFNLHQAHSCIEILREQIISNNRNGSDDNNGGAGLIGLDKPVDLILTCLIANEHALLEGNPGLAKTLASKIVAEMTGLAFQRIQFTPDLQPSDIISRNRITFNDGKPHIENEPGPIYGNIVLCDELNRASPKVQSATLEATEERSVTPLNQPTELIRPKCPVNEVELLSSYGPYYGEDKISAHDREGQVFMVLATQNPIEQEGVYPLAEAQLDRFMFKTIFEYPELANLEEISRHAFSNNGAATKESKAKDRALENHIRALYFFKRLRRLLLGKEAEAAWFDISNESLRSRLERFIAFTHAGPMGVRENEETFSGFGMGRTQSHQKERCIQMLEQWRNGKNSKDQELEKRISEKLRKTDYPDVETGASPRALLRMIQAIHARAFLKNKIDEYGVKPDWEDVAALSKEVLRHRVRLAIGSHTMGGTPERIVEDLLDAFKPNKS